MGFLSHRRRDVEVRPEQKWDFISLNDFKATSVGPVFAYIFLWVSLVISCAVYAVDVFTAYQLLAFNKWSSQIEPTQLIPFDISKWIFTICILLSCANLAYEFFRAIAIMRRGSVAECFLDSLAARLESIRLGSGKGWKRFLVFAELTKSKKGAEYIALFTFFSFQSWIRTLLLTGPRQVVNGLTLYSVYRAKLEINGSNFESSLADFLEKIQALATEEPRQAVVLSGMIFTFIIWFFSLLSLLLAALCFVFFLWGYIPREDGGLTGFCERKVNKRLKQIVADKINKAMAEEERKRKKAELKAAQKLGDDRPLTMKPSIPVLKDDDLPSMPSLNRADTFASFTTEKPTRTNTAGTFEMSQLKPSMPTRTNTKMTSSTKYSSRSSLLASAAPMGMSDPVTASPVEREGYAPSRAPTVASNRTYGPGSNLQRMGTNASSIRNYTQSPAPYAAEGVPAMPAPARTLTGQQYGNYRGPAQPRPNDPYRAGTWDVSRGDTRSPYPGDGRGPYQNPRPQYPGGNWAPSRNNTMSPFQADNQSVYANQASAYPNQTSAYANQAYPNDGAQYGQQQWPPYRADTQSPFPGDLRSQTPGQQEYPSTWGAAYREDTRTPYPADTRAAQTDDRQQQNTADKWAPDRGDAKTPYSNNDTQQTQAQQTQTQAVDPYANNDSQQTPGDDPYSNNDSQQTQVDDVLDAYSDDTDQKPQPPLDQTTTTTATTPGRASPAPTYRTNDPSNTLQSSQAGARPGGPLLRSATDLMPNPQRGNDDQFAPPMRANTQPMQSLQTGHQREGSGGSLSSLQSAMRTFQAYHARNGSVGASSVRNGQDGVGRTGTPQPGLPGSNIRRSPPPAASSSPSQQTRRRDEDDGNGWNRDLERGY
ncbi:hypothetical protein VTJ04DRAFT_10209 [Mycothermus thermophilus]|uniref:uncharacterized protein n=1 Tax=Humicola insolens TaxID=85995 RepID=UPI003742CBA4